MPTEFLSILLLLGLSGSPLLAWAQTGPGGYPQRTVRVIVPAASLTDPVSHGDKLLTASAVSDLRNIANP